MQLLSKWSKPNNPYYPDVHIFLILIPFIAAFNYYLTYANIQLNLFLVLTFTLDTIQGYIAIFVVRQLIIYLDQVLPYQNQLLKRISFQTILIVLVGVIVLAGLTEVVSLLARGKFVPLKFYTHDLPIISIWFFVVNGIYIIIFFYKEWQKVEATQQEFEDQMKEGLMIRWRNTNLRLDYHEVIGFSVDGDYSICYDQKGNKYYIEKSLSRISKDLPSQLFYRLNRQHILHRNAVAGFKRDKNGKLIALVKGSTLPAEINISRTKAASFKAWLYAKY